MKKKKDDWSYEIDPQDSVKSGEMSDDDLKIEANIWTQEPRITL